MAIFDYRDGNPSNLHPCRCFDAQTGEWVQHVFYYDTQTHQVGRYDLVRLRESDAGATLLDENGKPSEIWETRPLRLEPID